MIAKTFIKSLRIFTVVFSLCAIPALAAQAKYLNITLNGSYEEQSATDYNETSTTYGLELGIPITWFFELSFGHSVTQEKRVYSQEYTDYLVSRSLPRPESGVYTDKSNQLDTTANASLGYPIGYFYPYIFGGRLWRNVNQENSYYVSKPVKQETFNAGVGVSVFLTMQMRLKLSHRVSPSAKDSKVLDSLSSVGLSWGI